MLKTYNTEHYISTIKSGDAPFVLRSLPFMESDGFPEMRKHWAKFRKLRMDLKLINNEELRRKHMGAIISHPFIMAVAIFPHEEQTQSV